jgi:hypothetical protein
MDNNVIVKSARLGPAQLEVVPDGDTSLNKWLPASIAPPDTLVEVSVIDNRGVQHALMFPCCKSENEWVDPLSNLRIDIQPTHWRKWPLEGQRRNGSAP